jgi:feruloyl esterase
MVLLCLSAGWLGGPAHAAEGSPVACTALARADFTHTLDAPFTVTAASVVTAKVERPYCRAKGSVVPNISFELRLPISGWNHGFVLVGSGGWATEKFLFLCKEPLRRGYACIAADAGHAAGHGEWLQGNAQAKIDWGYRATHVTALAGKALVTAFYGAPPGRSLMLGTSTGGYQGLVEAQRYPRDFQGIVAVSPDIDEAGLAMRTLWTARNLTGDGGRPLFAAGDLGLLHKAALSACDLTDGVRDGVIGDPLGCRFDPHTVACKRGEGTGCLSARQADAAARIYSGPTTSTGESLAAGGLLPGSELGWPEVADDTFPDEFFSNALADRPEDTMRAAQFDFDLDHQRLGLAGTFISSNPDLRRFKQAGGKLILVQGGHDTVEQPRVLVDYYETVERVIGSRPATQAFARLFIVPGMNHTTGGDGAFAIDYLSAIERWVADGQAPAMLIASHVPEWATGNAGMVAGLTAPAAGQDATFTRPVYPYPLRAKYTGRGDPNNYRRFHPVR